jgi:hypothetical protein
MLMIKALAKFLHSKPFRNYLGAAGVIVYLCLCRAEGKTGEYSIAKWGKIS